jgi:phosphatidylserine/phosphatidylglycerophosphate/cardiolipin synthase-like enzyme
VNLLTPWKGLGRMHDKYMIVDNKFYLIGGRNTFGYFLGDYEGHKNYDRDVFIYNTEYEKKVPENCDFDKESSIYQIKKYYNEIITMDYCTLFHDNESLAEKKSVKNVAKELENRYNTLLQKYDTLLKNDYNYEENTYETNKITLISNPTTIYSKEPVVFYTLMKLAKNAKSNVKIHTPYIICNDYMYESLSEIGAKTQIMLNSAENNGNLFGALDYMNHKQKIIDTKMTIKEYEGGVSYHGKSMTIDDDMAIVGSFNMDMRSTYIDTEMMLAINSSEVTKQLKENMSSYEENSATVKTETEYSHIPEGMELKEISDSKKNMSFWLGWIFDLFRFLF